MNGIEFRSLGDFGIEVYRKDIERIFSMYFEN